MAYYTGTINSATPAVDLMAAFDPLLTSNGWTFIETYTNATNVTNIYKSPGASNSFGTDFYIGVNRTSTTSSVYFILGELYNSTTHYFRKYARNSNTIPDTDYSIVDATGLLPNNAALIGAAAQITVATSSVFTYWINVTVDRIMLTSSVDNTGNGGYVGLFDSLMQSDPFPIVTLRWLTSVSAGTTYGSTTRDPLQTAANTYNFNAQIFVNSYPAWGDQNLAGTSGWIYGSTGRAVQRAFFVGTRGLSVGQRGLLKDVVWTLAGSSPGDTLTYTIGATTYNYIRVPLYTTVAVNSLWMLAQ